MSKSIRRVEAATSAQISPQAILHGSIRIGGSTVIHPTCTIVAMKGPIEIGNECILEEKVYIENSTTEPLKIGNRNCFRIGSRILSPASIGSKNIIECNATINLGVSIEDGCFIATTASVPAQAHLKSGTVFVSNPPILHHDPDGEYMNNILINHNLGLLFTQKSTGKPATAAAPNKDA